MALLRLDQMVAGDVALDSIVMRLADLEDTVRYALSPYRLYAPDLIIEKSDTDEDLSQNKLDFLFWGSNRSWHEGAGQERLDMPRASSDFRFKESKGVDVGTTGQATLLKATSRTVTNTYSTTKQRLAVANDILYTPTTQPNLLKITSTSDAGTNFGTGTENSQNVRDLASDGETLYVALGPDGTHRVTRGLTAGEHFSNADSRVLAWAKGRLYGGGHTPNTQGKLVALDTFTRADSALSLGTSNTSHAWTALSGVWGISSNKGYEVNNTAEAHATIDVSESNGSITVDVTTRGAGTADIGIIFRVTDDNDYLLYRLTVGGGFDELFLTKVVAGASTTLASATSAGLALSTTYTMRVDFVGDTIKCYLDGTEKLNHTLTTAEFAQFGTQSLIGIRANSDPDSRFDNFKFYDARWRLFEVGSTTTSTGIHTLRAGWQIDQITELGPMVYFSANNGTASEIFAYDGTNTPFVALPMPPGEIVTGMTPFMGAGMLIGAKRYLTSTTNIGVLYVAFPNATGHLTLVEEEILTRGTASDAKDFGIGAGVGWSKEVFFPWPHDDASGLGVYFPKNAGYARHLYQNTGATGQIGGVAIWRGVKIFTVQGVGVFVEQGTYLASATLTSSRIDLNVSADKLWLAQESGFSLAANTTLKHEYSTDGGTTWTEPTGGTASSGSRNRSVLSTKAPTIQYRVTLATSNTSNTPTLYDSGIGGWPATKPKATHDLVVKAYPDQQLRTGEQRSEQSAGYDLLDALLDRRDSHEVLDYQPPWYKHSNTGLKVRVAGVETIGPWGTTGVHQGGLIKLRLVEVT